MGIIVHAKIQFSRETWYVPEQINEIQQNRGEQNEKLHTVKNMIFLSLSNVGLV